MTALTPDAVVLKFARQLKAAGADVRLDREAGTVVATAGPFRVLSGVRQGGPGTLWIATFENAPGVAWGPPAAVTPGA